MCCFCLHSIQILSDIPNNYSSKFKNPCYFDKSEKLHCLPYFLMIGAPKCGTTDIWFKIMYHPHIDYIKKEPHWWTRYSLRKGDGSASTLWQNICWEKFYPEDVKIGPPYIMADVIRHVLPETKIIISLREPTARLYSEYSAFRPKTKKSPEAFHAKVVKQITHFSSCLTKQSLRSCAYGNQRDSTVKNRYFSFQRLNVGLYSLYISEWLQRYPRDQMMILTLEEWQKRCTKILPKIFTFLSVGKYSN
ncbi:Carbohydrate sulfotransferase 15 [Holothuria leucospilota]|uniref:Carbohydrate sulfotransferase 15 n=1 Tax=Holothuria leucospilota TaxID=206669 RepID=A0A9Q1HJG0_HOLLE|nr:Carbohydrate sulfotransferase 15 [Holothuria leucospilota]